MQCPECNHIPLAGNQPDPSRCPECGIYYQKALELRLAAKSKQQAAAQLEVAKAMSPKVKAVMAQYKGAQPVVIVDMSMSFNSMVVFMVKWVIASIPAMMILFALALVLSLLFGGLIGLGK